MTVTWRKRRDLNPRTLAGRSLSSSAFARSRAFRDALTCGFRDGCNLWGAAVRRRTETQTETWWRLNGLEAVVEISGLAISETCLRPGQDDLPQVVAAPAERVSPREHHDTQRAARQHLDPAARAVSSSCRRSSHGTRLERFRTTTGTTSVGVDNLNGVFPLVRVGGAEGLRTPDPF